MFQNWLSMALLGIILVDFWNTLDGWKEDMIHSGRIHPTKKRPPEASNWLNRNIDSKMDATKEMVCNFQ